MANHGASDALIISLTGHLDVYRAPEVRRTLSAASRRPRLIVDLSQVASISAAILTEFVRCYKQRLAAGLEPARLVVRTQIVRKVLEVTELASVWQIYPSIEAASMP